MHPKAARLWKEQGARWLTIEWLPAYAPDLNPVEAMWSCTNYTDLVNDTPAKLDGLAEAATDSLISQYGRDSAKRSYFQTAKLNL